MKSLRTAILTSLLLLLPCMASAAIEWHENYALALAEAKEEGKPLFLLFTGSDWCGWCMRLEKEVLNTREFQQKMEQKLIFVKVDFPSRAQLDAEVRHQNETLKRQFSVRGFPTVLIIDENENQIAQTGYREGGGSDYADYLSHILKENQNLSETVHSIEGQQATADDLEKSYQRARRLGALEAQKQILEAGLETKKNGFFLTEKYRKLVEEKGLENKEAQTIKKKILATQGAYAQDLSYRLAIIEFQSLSENSEQKDTGDRVIAPLLNYLQAYGQSPSQEHWKIHMMIAQVLLNKSRLKDALFHLQASHDLAPETFQDEITLRILKVKKDLKSK